MVSETKGSINFFTNSLFLMDLPMSEYIRSALEGRIPDRLLPVFLHETTHHWCLSGSVGKALAQLELEIHRDSGEQPGKRSRNWLVLTAARSLLEPLLEGLALFAEFDIYPGCASTISGPLAWVTRLFHHGEMPQDNVTLDTSLGALLTAYRLSDAALNKKSGILVRPLKSEEGGYLLGYLAIKAVWAEAKRNSRRLYDADLFLSYIRNLVFDDCGLVELLLEEPSDVEVTFNSLCTRLHCRLKLFGSADLESRVTLFEQAISERGMLDGAWESLYLETEDVNRSHELLYQRGIVSAPGNLRSSWKPSPAETLSENKRLLYEYLLQDPDQLQDKIRHLDRTEVNRFFADAALLHHRPFLRIHSATVRVVVDEQRMCRVFAAGALLFSVHADPEAPIGEGEATLALYFLPDDYAIAFVCIRDNLPVWTSFPAGMSAIAKELALGAIAQTLLSDPIRLELSNAIACFENARRHASGFLSATKRSILNTYLNHVLCYVPKEKLAVCLDAMQKQGFWQILGEDGDLVSSLAAFGLLSSCSKLELKGAGSSGSNLPAVDHAISLLTAAQQEFGYTFLYESGHSLTCLV
jgi:hypothetical protein